MIYLLEDDDSIRKLVTYGLQSQGYEAAEFALPSAFWKAMKVRTPELVLLDLMLPEEDGLSILKRLRADPATRAVPVIILTAKNAEYDRIIGLDQGADDFISKPFGIMELMARIRAVLRRSLPASPAPEQMACGPIALYPQQHAVTVGGRPVQLTNKEYALLKLLMQNRGIVLTRSTLLDRVWGLDLDRENRTLDVHIRSLRVKLEEAGPLIETVRGVGYRLGGCG